MKQKNKEKGITLIALVVTIIVLMILATVSINMIMNMGILNKVDNAIQMHKKTEELERLELIKATVAIDNKGKVTVDTYIKEVIKEGITVPEEVEDNGDGSKNIITDNGWSINIAIDLKNPNNIVITVEGKGDKLPPRIIKQQLTKNVGSIKVEVEAKRAEGAIYKYYYKELDKQYVLVHEGNETSYTIENIEANADCTIKVEVINQYGTAYKEVELIAEPPTNWDSSKVNPIKMKDNIFVPIPKGFYYIGGDIETGLVISDKKEDTLESQGIESGNQFVWIPVSRESDLQRTLFDNKNGQPKENLGSTKYIEPEPEGYLTEEEEYNTMKDQVLKYGGFYIGRYEAGVNGTTYRTKLTEAQEVVSKRGVAPYNWVPWGKAMNDASEIEGIGGAVHIAKNMYKTSESVVSTLVYGCQWDAMCRYIGDSQRERGTFGLTGSSLHDVSKKIYDLGGGCYEITMESDGNGSRVGRGGHRGYGYIHGRCTTQPSYAGENISFRCALYIK